MSEVTALKSYLVGLGFSVNNADFAKFENALTKAEKLTKNKMVGIAADAVKWGAAITGVFASITSAVVGAADKVAMSDQQFRLFGERMFMSTEHARAFKIAVDALGGDPAAIAFDPELHGRYRQLQKDQLALGQGLGGNFEDTMREIRDVRFEFTRFQIELQYGLMGVVQQIFKQLGLGSGDLAKQLSNLNDKIIKNLPEWSRKFATYVVPVLKDAWMIFKDLVQLGGDLATMFTNIVGIFTGDPTLMGRASFDKFARSIDKVLHLASLFVRFLTKIAGILAGTFAGGSLGAIIGGLIGGIGGGPLGALAGAATGGTIGSGIGAGAGAIVDAGRAFWHHANPGNPTDILSGGGISSQARSAAAQVGAALGVDPSVIFAQWAHETNGFTNRGAIALNNLAGIRIAGSSEYKSFGSIDDFARYYTSQIRRNYSGAIDAKDIDSYAAALNRGRLGSWYEDTYNRYDAGMRRHAGDYSRGGGSGDVNVQVGDINVHGTNLGPDEIKRHVTKAITDAANTQTQQTRLALVPSY